MDFWTAIWVHVIAALPGVAALITALRTKRDTQQIVVLVNGERDRLQSELAAARIALTQRGHE